MKKNNKKKKNLTKKEIIKETINKLLPGIIIIFVSAFMFLIYEPLLMYSTNINDFWFDFSLLFSSNIIIFLTIFLLFFLIYMSIYFIDKSYFKNNKLLNIFTIILFGLFILFYIQGNFLIYDLPKLDRSIIRWNMYSTQNFISILLFNIIFISLVISCYKFKIEKVVNITKYVALTIFVMLSVSLITTILTTEDVFKSKITVNITNKNIDKYSKNENFIIFVVDAIDSMVFKNVLENSEEYNNTFEDFTYYPDTVSGYIFTRDSVPFILSGKWNKNKTTFAKHSTNALDNSILLNTLKEKDYDLNIYENEIIWQSKKAEDISNFKILNSKIDKSKLFSEELKYIYFKYLPFPFKRFSNIETMDYNTIKKDEKLDIYNYYNYSIYHYIKHLKYKVVEEKQFKFIHIEGGHVPFNYDKDVNLINDGTYAQKVEATLTIINTYLEKLKELNVYDNSNIIVMSDHGYSENSILERINPILFIKGINEKHEMYESDIPVSQEDLNEVYIDLLKGKTSEELLQKVDKERERKFMYYEHTKENHMTEYIQKGKAWDQETIEETGEEFNR